ncbi:uncharacterized protein LOC115215137 [Octopus sinensis]|uniref:Uncharacterized protein LOC115215137 n=1 Tax=Octopus sinensis TaxID=2607531 RepID=A0A7E6F098_9MOLL|nr:uncharacterized protein LOC115215137 [Octopus sinensis]
MVFYEVDTTTTLAKQDIGDVINNCEENFLATPPTAPRLLYVVVNFDTNFLTTIKKLLNPQYKSAFSIPLGKLRVNVPDRFFDPEDTHCEMVTIDNINIEETDVISAIEELSSNSATGPDGFPALLLKKCKRALARPLQILFQESLRMGKLPKKLKEGIICPIHKGGSRAEARNYRPVSLTSHVSKGMGHIVRKRLIEFLEDNDLLSDTHHGFRPVRSCLTQLLRHYDWVLKQLMNCSKVDVV